MTENRKPLIVLCHGITEYKERYDQIRKALNSRGIDLIAYDIRGFGERKNETGKSWQSDVDELVRLVKSQETDRDLFVLGFSLGSFVVRCALPQLTGKNCHFILAGTGQTGRPVLALVKKVMDREVSRHGYYEPTKLTQKLLFEQYNRKFSDEHTEAAWLLRDPSARQAYLNDEKILHDIPCGYFRDMLQGMILAQKVSDRRRILNLTGAEDPVGNFGKDVQKLQKQYPNMESHIIADGRHDLLHDFCSNAVLDMIAQFVEKEAF